MEVAIVIGLLIVAIILFATEKLPIDIVTWILLILLVLAGIITPREAFDAFSSDFIIMLASIFVITSAIETSGIMSLITDSISKTKTGKVVGALIWTAPLTALVSGLVNNTTLTALMIPPLLSIAKRSDILPSKLLMPMAFASIVGGSWTIIGTSTNIAVRGYLVKEGFDSLGIFSIAPIGLVMIGIFIIYMLTIGRYLIPERKAGKLLEEYKVRDYLTEIKILPGSDLVGQNVYGSSLANSGFRILGIVRNKRKFYPTMNTAFVENDLILVNGNMNDLLKVTAKSGVTVTDDSLDVFYKTGKEGKLQLMELLIPGSSGLVGRTIKAVEFRKRYGLYVVAIHRAGRYLSQLISSIRLQAGDLLLVQGTVENFADVSDQHNLLLMEAHKINPNRVKKGMITVAVFLLAILLTTLNVLPPDIAFLSAAVITVLLQIIEAENVYSTIDWRMLVLIAGMTAFGTAMKNSGTDLFVAEHFIAVFDGFGARGVMLGFMILTVLLTQPMSNAAAALVVLPIAIQSALTLEANPMTFAVAIMLSASVSLITPFEPSCVLIYAPGRYKFTDFARVGGLLTLLLMAVIYFMVPMYWPL